MVRARLRQRLLDWQFSQAELEHREGDVNWDIVEGQWKQFKGQVQMRWGRLTDDDLDVIAGKRLELAGRIQEAYGISKGEAEQQLKCFAQQHKDFRTKSSS